MIHGGISMADMSNLYDYAFCGTETGFSNMLKYLSELAEEEKWSFDETKPHTIVEEDKIQKTRIGKSWGYIIK